MKKIKSLAFSIGLFINCITLAQQDFTLYNMEVVPQRMYMNPALFPSYSKVNIGLPMLSSQYINFSNSGFKYSDAIKHRADDSLYLDYDNMLTKLTDKNYISLAYQPDLLSFGFRMKEKNYISFTITEKVQFRFRYPKSFMEFLWKGNGGLLGEEVKFNFGVDFTHYREYGIGYTRIVNDKLTLGGKLKYLYGMENVYTEKSDISLTTDPTTFDITAKANVAIHTSGLENDTAFNATNYMFKKKNQGIGIDLGGVYKINDKLSLSASIIDLGFIKWKSSNTNYTSKNSDASFTYRGIEFNDFFTKDTTKNPIDIIVDSLSEIFKIEKTHTNYTTKLSSQIYLGGNYFITKKSNIGVLFYSQLFDKKIHPGTALSYNQRVGRWLNVSASYSIYNRSYNNIGLGLALNGGPVQLYVVSDNILGAFLPQNTKNLHLHFGINLTLGRRIQSNDKDKDGIPDKTDLCIDVPGVLEFSGCPDKDGDHVPDKEDECPDDAGLALNKGCPDRDMDKILDKVDTCPDEPGLVEFNGCPDRDGDKLTDKEDECPDEAGPIELKGCPDRDADGMPDKTDKCPEKRGPVSNNGCPEVKLTLVDSLGNRIQSAVRGEDGMFRFNNLPTDEKVAFNLEGTDTPMNEIMVVVNGETKKASRDGRDNYFKFVILKQEATTLKSMEEEDVAIKLNSKDAAVVKKAFNTLEFASGKDLILPSSKASLNELANLLFNNPKWRLKISGHTDNQGTPVSNLKLSQKRAEAVQSYLVSKGVRSDRFKVEWYGQAKPIADNATEQGRQKNRRVEMLIIH